MGAPIRPARTALVAIMVAGTFAAVTSLPAHARPAQHRHHHARVYPSWSPFAPPTTKSVPVRAVVGNHTPTRSRTLTSGSLEQPVWPVAGTRSVTLPHDQSVKPAATSGTSIRVARTGVLTARRLATASARRSAQKVRGDRVADSVIVRTLSHAAATQAGVNGVLLSVQQPPGSTSGAVSVDLSYAGFGQAYGGGYGSRLHLVRLPSCVLTTPSVPACRVQTPVASSANNATARRLVADVRLPASAPATSSSRQQSATVLAATSGPSGTGGDYRATSLSAEGSWSVNNSGAFGYSYPIAAPPSVGNFGPTVALNYDSSSVDGRTSTANAQASWVGDGWDYAPGFIERSYKSCADDGHSDSSDECWAGDNGTVSLNGQSNRLVPTSPGGSHYRMKADNGSTIDEISVSDTSTYFNGMHAGTYWRMTADDGTQYFFGADHLPSSVGGDGKDTNTNAAWGVPVYGDDSGEPCNASSFDASHCTQGWRWNLDFEVDPYKNIIVYRYGTETNNYSAGTNTTPSSRPRLSYTRGGYLASITYGQLASDYVAKATPGDELDFSVTGRCDGKSGFSCATAISDSNQGHFPDVPWDQNCSSSTSSTCTAYSPTFWSTKALSKIATKVWDESLSTPGWSSVDSYTLSAPSFPAPGDADPSGGVADGALWLNSITHTGADTRGGGSAVSTSATTFAGTPMPNRVEGLAAQGTPPINRNRLTIITSATGAVTTISYSHADSCTSAPTEDNNTTRCFPVRWIPFGYTDPVLDWFYTYPVTEIDANDNGTVWGANQSPTHVTKYGYAGAAWHRDDDQYTPDKARTWGQFRGYAHVTTTSGADPDPITQTVTDYLQGMDNDHRKDGSQRNASVTTAAGESITDSDYFAGQDYQTSTYSDEGGTVRDVTIKHPWASPATATQTVSGLPDISARFTDIDRTDHRQLLSDGSWRTNRTASSIDPATGLVTRVDDLGQINGNGDPIGATTPESCTTTIYASDSSRNMIDFPAQVVTTAGGCTSSVGANTVSASKSYYGSATLGAIASTNDGDVTAHQSLKQAAASPVWAAQSTMTYDSYGRETATKDPVGRSTTTSYGVDATHKKYLPTRIDTTNALSWTTSTTLDPGRQLPISATDANSRVTTETYDGLGRLTQVWLPNHAQSTHSTLPSLKFAYVVTNSTFVTTTTSTLEDSDHYQVAIDIYDALLQKRQTQSTPKDAETTTRLISNTKYDSHGWAQVSDPDFYNDQSAPSTTPDTAAFSGNIPSETVTGFDGRGRPTRSALYANGTYEWQSTTSYPGEDETRTTPPSGGVATTSITDARAQQIELQQDPSGAQANTTYYSYNAAGKQTTLVGPVTGVSDTAPGSSPDTWTTAYDALGNITRTTDPDAGTTVNSYNDDSELVQAAVTGNETGASTRTLSYTRDNLGRITTEYNGTTTGPKIGTWAFDTAATGKGQLATETEYAANGTTATYTRTVSGYNANYQPTATKITIPANTYGNTAAITYQDSYTYTPTRGNLYDDVISESGAASLMPNEDYGFSYNDTGLPDASGGASTYESSTLYDPHGRVVRATTGVMPLQALITNSWDPATGRLKNTTFNRENGSSAVDDVDYTYNQAGHITSATNVQGGGTSTVTDLQCYRYDTLNRLTDAWTDTGGTTGGLQAVGGVGTCNHTTPSTDNVGGPAPYWQSYSYDITGNRTSRTDHATVTGGSDQLTSETHSGTGDAHALHTVSTGTGATASVKTYQYDGGRPTTTTTAVAGTADTTKAQTFTWAPQGNIASLKVGPSATPSHTTTYGYDPEGNQIARTTDGTTTLFLGQDAITLTGGTATQVIRQYAFPGGATIVRTATTSTKSTASDAVHYQMTDPQGTAYSDVAGTTLTTSRRGFTAFGELRPGSTSGTTFAADTLRGFLNAPTDPTNQLQNVGARQYDPSLGTFLTVDPLLNPADPQSINGYAYADNDPVNKSDPSGAMIPSNGGDGYNVYDGTGHLTPSKSCMRDYCAAQEYVRPTYTGGVQSNYNPYGDKPAPKKKNYDTNHCGSVGWLCNILGINNTINCAGHPGLGRCAAAAFEIFSDVTIASAAVKGIRGIRAGIRGAEAGTTARAADAADGEGGDLTTLYRAVSKDELKDIEGTGQYRPAPSGIDGKYFFPTKGQAETFQGLLEKSGKGPTCITSGCFPTSMLRGVAVIHPAGEGLAYYVPNGLLPYFNSIVIHGR